MKKQLHILILSFLSLFIVNVSNAQIVAFPYTQDFESFTSCGTGCGATCALSSNWQNDLTDNLDWLTDVGGTSSSSTGPSIDHNPGTSSGKYLYVESSCSGTGYPNFTANLLSPTIDLTGTNNVQFEFWYHMFGSTMGNLHVDISTDGGLTWTNDIVPAWATGDN